MARSIQQKLLENVGKWIFFVNSVDSDNNSNVPLALLTVRMERSFDILEMDDNAICNVLWLRNIHEIDRNNIFYYIVPSLHVLKCYKFHFKYEI